MRRDLLGLLRDIHAAAQFIVDDTTGMTFDAFAADRRTRQLVERNFEIIGEAINRLRRHDPAVASRISGYNQIVSLRNALIHGYDVIDSSTLWKNGSGIAAGVAGRSRAIVTGDRVDSEFGRSPGHLERRGPSRHWISPASPRS